MKLLRRPLVEMNSCYPNNLLYLYKPWKAQNKCGGTCKLEWNCYYQMLSGYISKRLASIYETCSQKAKKIHIYLQISKNYAKRS